jgi:hypothetical protein
MGLRALNKGTPFQPKVVRYTFILIHLTHLYQTLAWTLGASKYTFVRRCISWLTTTISFLAGIENFTPSIDIYSEGSPLNNIQFPLLCFLIKFSRVFLKKKPGRGKLLSSDSNDHFTTIPENIWTTSLELKKLSMTHIYKTLKKGRGIVVIWIVVVAVVIYIACNFETLIFITEI